MKRFKKFNRHLNGICFEKYYKSDKRGYLIEFSLNFSTSSGCVMENDLMRRAFKKAYNANLKFAKKFELKSFGREYDFAFKLFIPKAMFYSNCSFNSLLKNITKFLNDFYNSYVELSCDFDERWEEFKKTVANALKEEVDE